MSPIRDPMTLIKMSLSLGTGPGDSIIETLSFLAETARLLNELPSREMLLVASERLIHTIQYSGYAKNLSRILEELAEEVSRNPRLIGMGSRKITDCFLNQILNYTTDILEKTYAYCRNLKGRYIVLGRGVLTLGCTLGLKDSLGSQGVIIPLIHAKNSIFNKVDSIRVPWTSLYQYVEEGTVDGIISQAEATTQKGVVTTPGTLELVLLGVKKGVEINIFSHPLNLYSGSLPLESDLPTKRYRSPGEIFEEEYPLLELLEWNIAGFNEVIINGVRQSITLRSIRRTLQRSIPEFLDGVVKKC